VALVLAVLVVHMVVSDTHRRRRHRHHIQALELGAYCTTFAKSGEKWDSPADLGETVGWLSARLAKKE
jgi:hypothetical protein